MERFTRLIKILKDASIDFVIVGGFAAVLHGGSQVTQDLDVCIEFNPENIQKLRFCLKDYHPVHRMTPNKLSFLDHPSDVSTLKNLYLKTDIGILDLLGLVGGVGEFKELNRSAIDIELFQVRCKIISVEDLICAKKFMGRPKDLFTVRELECLGKT